MKDKREIDYCTCQLHYVCYMGPVCANRGCGKPHPGVTDPEILANPLEHLPYTTNEETGEKKTAWSVMDGSVQGDFDYRHRYDDKINRKWWEFWK